MIFAGSAGTLLWLISLLCLGLWAASAAAGWRSGDRRLILGGGLLLALCAAPSVLLLAACFSGRSEEHTSELQSLMRISYAVFCLKKKKTSIISKDTI